jgi:hypothetical protein
MNKARKVVTSAGSAIDHRKTRNPSSFAIFVFIFVLVVACFTVLLLPWHNVLEISHRIRKEAFVLSKLAHVSEGHPVPKTGPVHDDIDNNTVESGLTANSSMNKDNQLQSTSILMAKKRLMTTIKELFDLGKSSPDQLIDMLNNSDPLGRLLKMVGLECLIHNVMLIAYQRMVTLYRNSL